MSSFFDWSCYVVPGSTTLYDTRIRMMNVIFFCARKHSASAGASTVALSLPISRLDSTQPNTPPSWQRRSPSAAADALLAYTQIQHTNNAHPTPSKRVSDDVVCSWLCDVVIVIDGFVSMNRDANAGNGRTSSFRNYGNPVKSNFQQPWALLTVRHKLAK